MAGKPSPGQGIIVSLVAVVVGAAVYVAVALLLRSDEAVFVLRLARKVVGTRG